MSQAKVDRYYHYVYLIFIHAGHVNNKTEDDYESGKS